MITFLEVSDDDPALLHSPMVRAIEKTFAYVSEQGCIGLTPLKAFKRNFVHWAAAEFNWPYYSADELFQFNKILNEMDFLPLEQLHRILIALKIGRHYQQTFKLTKTGQAFVGRPGKIFGVVAPFFLFQVDHGYLFRDDRRIDGNWEIYLNALNVEAQNGVTGAEIRRAIYGAPKAGDRHDPLMSHLAIEVLSPLCWMGLLHEYRTEKFYSAEDTVFTKTPLWKSVLRLASDDAVQQATLH